MKKTLLRQPLIYDGGGNKPYRANILIAGERIVAITEDEPDADCVIDAEDEVAAPGFIDAHRHCDIAVLEDSNFGELELAQGLTSVVGGNCGLAPVPSTALYREKLGDFIEPCLGRAKVNLSYYEFSDYLQGIAQALPPINVGALVGMGAVKAAIKGYGNSPFTGQELAKAADYIETAVKEGALGLSMGIMYTPECFSTKEEMIPLAHAAAKQGGILSCHMRGEGDTLVESVSEILEISRKAEIPLNISHFKATGISNWNSTLYRAIELIDKARGAGQSVTVDFYPYTAGATTLLSLLPPEYLAMDISEALALFQEPKTVAKLQKDLFRKHEHWDNMVESIGLQRIILNSFTRRENMPLSGLSIPEASKVRGCSDPVKFLCDILAEEEGKVGIILQSMSQEDVDAVAKLPYSTLISDALYGNTHMPHPRLYGATAQFLQDFVLKRKILPMETAIRKMTAQTAMRFGIVDRGEIKVGGYADINLFQPEKFIPHATYAHPQQVCTGISKTFVNGACHGERAGQVLKNKS